MMEKRLRAQPKPAPTPSCIAARGVLQRKCACGGTPGPSGECAECRKRRLQRRASNQGVSGAGFSLSGISVIQPKLTIGASNDPLEQEADRIADRVLATPVHSSVASAPLGIQRFSGHPTGQMDAAPASVDHALASPGRPLEPALRQDMEQRFGHDLSRVRVHTDARAGESAMAVNARAYTVGRNIVFGSGQYAPQARSGQRLLAHELTHFVQQSRNVPPPILQRVTHDFEIRGKFEDSASFSNFAFFTQSATTLDAAEKAKVDAFALPAGDMLTLNGFASEEGSTAGNLAVVNSRLDAVAAELVLKGHDRAKITKVQMPSSGKGRIDYRRMRSVEIVKPGGASAVPPAAAPATAACAGSNETDFKAAEKEAEDMIDKSVTALTPPIGRPMTALLNRLFSGWAAADAATLKSKLSDIKMQLHRLLPAANHKCGSIKYAACDAGTEAENSGAGAAAMMTMCPTFFGAGNTKKDRGGTLLHEASHGTPGLLTSSAKEAYSHERLIEFLGVADALKNSDSYRLLVRLFDLPGSMTVGPAAPDPLTGGMIPAEKTAARQAMAWMEKWLIWSYQEMSSLYNTIHASIAAGAWTNGYYEVTMGLVAPLFGLTVPPMLPTNSDKIKVAAIHDRFHIMRSTEWSKTVTLHKVAAGPERWAPGPGSSVDLGPTFFADTPRGRLDRLLTAIATATPDVSAPFVAKYVVLADKIRTHQGGAAP